jgi:hypothetical protein
MDAFVVALRENSGGFIQLNISFTRVAHDWEVDVFASFFRVSYLARVGLECKDNCCGSLPKQGCLLLNPSTLLWVVIVAFAFFGRVFGGQKFI